MHNPSTSGPTMNKRTFRELMPRWDHHSVRGLQNERMELLELEQVFRPFLMGPLALCRHLELVGTKLRVDVDVGTYHCPELLAQFHVDDRRKRVLQRGEKTKVGGSKLEG